MRTKFFFREAVFDNIDTGQRMKESVSRRQGVAGEVVQPASH
jgi:hypothetical protein